MSARVRKLCPAYLDANFDRHLDAFVLVDDPVLKAQKEARLKTDLDHIRRRAPYYVWEAYRDVYLAIVGDKTDKYPNQE